jgi:hypothetical protein
MDLSTATPDSMLSTNYSIADLCLTNQSLTAPNFPDSQYQLDNLVLLADMLENLTTNVGPFTILSGFRTHELQVALKEGGAPTGSGALSFHEVGRAVDINPTSMSLADYFGTILANQDLANQFAELALKPSQNAIHMSINVPGDTRTPRILVLDPTTNSYVKATTDQIASYVANVVSAADAATLADDYSTEDTGGLYVVLALCAIFGYFYWSPHKRLKRT